MAPTGEGCQGVAAGSNPEPERGQPAPPGGVLQRLHQAQEVHRVGVQHHRHELTHRAAGCSTSGAWPLSKRIWNASACSVPALNHRNPKNTTWTVSSRSLCRAFYKPVPTWTAGRPCGICGRIATNRDFNFGGQWKKSGGRTVWATFPAACTPFLLNFTLCVQVMGCLLFLHGGDCKMSKHTWRGLTSPSPVSSPAHPITRILFDWY